MARKDLLKRGRKENKNFILKVHYFVRGLAFVQGMQNKNL